MRLVYYSLANSPASRCETQWTQSIRSLRRYNASIPVWLALFNGASAELHREAARWNVAIGSLGDYRTYLERLSARGSILAMYPTFHKFLALADAPVERATQVLYLDCDTFFFGDVERLFDDHADAHWYAREEPDTRLSHFGYDPSYVDEEMLAVVAGDNGARPLVPFNSGVCLLNHEIWQRFSPLSGTYLDLAWRLLCGVVLSTEPCIEPDAHVQQAVLAALDPVDRTRMLPYPSSNAWIIEQVALWLALGHVPGLSQGILSRVDVVQGGEWHDADRRRKCVLAHYFSTCEREFFAAVPALPA